MRSIASYGMAAKYDSVIGRNALRGGATDFKVGGTKQDSRAERAKKNFLYPPTFPIVGGTRKRISVQYNTILYSIVLYCTLNTRVFKFNVQPKADGSQLNLPRGSLVYHTDVL